MYGEVVDGVDGERFEKRSPTEARARRRAGRRPDAEDLRELVETFKQIYEEELGRAFPQDAARAAAPRRPGGLRLLGHAARAGLPARERHPGRPRDGGQRRPDGLRQHGPELGHGRLLHSQPVHGRGAPLRRVPRQRAGRGRRRRHPHAGADRAHARRAPGRVRQLQRHDATASRRTTATCRTSSSRSRRGRSTCSRREPGSARRPPR